MIKKFLYIVSILFIFTSSIAVAEMYKQEDIIKINNIQMVEHVAYKIVNYAVKNIRKPFGDVHPVMLNLR